MEDPPLTPDSEATLRGFIMPPCTPLRKTRLYELGSEKKAAASPSDLNPRASPFESASQTPTNAQFPHPFTQEQEVEQRFRPSCGGKAPDEEVCSLSSTSETPNSGETKRFDSHGDAHEEYHHGSPDTATWYGGVPLRPNQLPTLTTYGLADKHSDPSPASKGNDTSSSDDDAGGVPFTPSSSDAKSALIGSITHGFDKTEANKSASNQARQGYGLNFEGEQGDYRVASQTKSFNDLAKQRGINEWDNKTFDNRWQLRSDETLCRASPPKYDLPKSTRSLSKNDGSTGTTGATSKVVGGLERQNTIDKSYGYGTSQKLGQEPEFSRIEFPVTDRPIQSSSIDGTLVGQMPHRSEANFVTCPPEATRLQQIITEMETGRIQFNLPIHSRLPFERYFNERVFGNLDGPAPFGHHEAQLLTKFNNQILTLENLREEVIKEINYLISQLMTPTGKRLIQLDDGTGPDAEGTHPLLSTATQARGRHGPKLDASLRNIASIAHQRRYSHSQNIDSHDTDHNQYNRILQDTRRPAGSYDSHPSEVTRPSQGTYQNGSIGFVPGFKSHAREERYSASRSDSEHNEFSDLSSALGGVRLGSFEESPSGSTRTVRSQTKQHGNEGQYPSNRAETSSVYGSSEASQGSLQSAAQQGWTPSYSSGAPTPYVTPERMSLGGQQVTAASMLPPFYPGNQTFTPAQIQAWQQFQAAQGMQHVGLPVYGYPQQYGSFPTTQPSSLPPGVQAYQGGMWLPDGREARAPARSRLAPQHVHDPRFNTDSALAAAPQRVDFQRRSQNSTPARFINRDRLLYLEGSDEMYPQQTTGGGASVRYQNLMRHSPPGALAMQEENRPFTTQMREPAKWGVMKIGNIPYDLSRQSVLSFLGNHAKLITPDFGPSVHIIMDRATGKTQDCYVEFFSIHDAQAWVKVINSRGNLSNRIGDRILDVSLTSQDELLKELFPRAKNVAWKDGHPTFEQSNDQYNTGFKTFLSAEELQTLARHAEQPHRSAYTLKCQNRPYESMISLLAKFPWQSTANYTLTTRNKIFEAAHKMLLILSNIVRRSSSHRSTPSTSSMTSPVDQLYGPFSAAAPPGAVYGYPAAGAMMPARPTTVMPKPLNAALLQDLLRAALNAQGFSEAQRWQLYTTVSDATIRANFRISPISAAWPFQAVRRKARMEEDVVEFYAHLISHHPYVAAQVQPSCSSTTIKPNHAHCSKFGEVGAMIDRDIVDTMNMRDITRLEERAIEQILRDQCGES